MSPGSKSAIGINTMGEDSTKSPRTTIFAVGPIPAGLGMRPKDRLVRVKCATPECHKMIWVKKSKVGLKRKPKCHVCNRSDALSSASQGHVAAHCNTRNEAARRRTDSGRTSAST
jgi:hypothetical protein